MNVPHLVEMANQIGEFFEAMPDRDEALAGIATHIRKFWAPRMRAALAAHLAGAGGEPLTPIVREALQRHAWALA
jgi:formate dehydrogenase subunit delta